MNESWVQLCGSIVAVAVAVARGINGMESTIGKHNGMEKQAEKEDEELKAAFKAHKPEFAAECTHICKWIHT